TVTAPASVAAAVHDDDARARTGTRLHQSSALARPPCRSAMAHPYADAASQTEAFGRQKPEHRTGEHHPTTGCGILCRPPETSTADQLALTTILLNRSG